MELENKKLNNLLIHFNQERIKNMSNKSFLMAQRDLRSSSSINLRKNKIKNFEYGTHQLNKKRPKTGLLRSHFSKKKILRQKKNRSSDEKGDFDLLNKTSERKNDINNNNEKDNDIIKLAKDKWRIGSSQLKEFMKIKESKNQDKILKVHNQQPLLKCINEFNQLIKHTNKLFVYKYRIAPRKANNNGIDNMTNKYLASKALRKNKSLEEIKNDKTEVKIGNEMSLNIENKINELIKVLKEQNSK